MGFRRRAISFLMDRGVRIPREGCRNSDLCKMVAKHCGLQFDPKIKMRDQIEAFFKAGKTGFKDAIVPVTKKSSQSRRTRMVSSIPGPAFYDSDQWRLLRYQVLKRYGGRCQCCGRGAADGVTLHVDHIQPRSKRPDLELDMNNLQVLCADCNLGKLAWDTTDWRPFHSQPESPEHKTGIGQISPVGQRKLN